MLMLGLTLSISATALANETLINKFECPNVIRVTAICAITGDPFYALFDPETNIVSSFQVNGEFTSYRQLENKEAFWDLVAFNAKMTNPDYILPIAMSATPNAGSGSFCHETNTMTMYDGYGNSIEKYFDSFEELLEFRMLMREAENAYGFAPAWNSQFNTGWLRTFVPIVHPVDFDRMNLVGGRFYREGGGHFTDIDLFMQRASTTDNIWMDFLLINQWGDDFQFWHSTLRRHVWYRMRFLNEAYGARVSTEERSGNFHHNFEIWKF